MNFEIENKREPGADFERIANMLMNRYVLIAGNNRYRLTDIEFYYYNEADEHADVYAHNHDLQKRHSHWYLHPSGLDITFGDGVVSGGILIRGIKHLYEKNKFTDGPIKCVQEFFSNFGKVDDPEKISFYLQEVPQSEQGSLVEHQEVYKCRRVGINKLKDSSEARFYNEQYRFLIYPSKPHGEKKNLAEDLLSQNMTKEEINQLFRYKYFKL